MVEFEGMLVGVQYVISHHLHPAISVIDSGSLVKAMNDIDVELERQILPLLDRP